MGLKLRPVRTLLAIGSVLLLASAFSASGSDEPFGVQVIPSTGRTVTAELTDLDGDGRIDVLQAVVFDMPPNERRIFRVYLQQSDGAIPGEPDLEVEIPASVAAYDLANIDGAPGDEVLLLPTLLQSSFYCLLRHLH